MAISFKTYGFDSPDEHCGGQRCLERAGQQARSLVAEKTKEVTAQAEAKIKEAESLIAASRDLVQLHIDRIVALELEVARLKQKAQED